MKRVEPEFILQCVMRGIVLLFFAATLGTFVYFMHIRIDERKAINRSELTATQARVVKKTMKRTIVCSGKSTVPITTYRLHCRPDGVKKSYSIRVDKDVYDSVRKGDSVDVTMYIDKKSRKILDLEFGDLTKDKQLKCLLVVCFLL